MQAHVGTCIMMPTSACCLVSYEESETARLFCTHTDGQRHTNLHAVPAAVNQYSRWGNDFVADDRACAMEERKRRHSNDLLDTTGPGASATGSRRASNASGTCTVRHQALDNSPETPTHHHGTRSQKRKSNELAASAAAPASSGPVGAQVLLSSVPWDADERDAVVDKR